MTAGNTDQCIFFIIHFVSDRISEGMRELDAIRDKRDVILCTTMALMYAHKRCKTVGKSQGNLIEESVVAAHRAVTFEVQLLYLQIFS